MKLRNKLFINIFFSHSFPSFAFFIFSTIIIIIIIIVISLFWWACFTFIMLNIALSFPSFALISVFFFFIFTITSRCLCNAISVIASLISFSDGNSALSSTTDWNATKIKIKLCYFMGVFQFWKIKMLELRETAFFLKHEKNNTSIFNSCSFPLSILWWRSFSRALASAAFNWWSSVSQYPVSKVRKLYKWTFKWLRRLA